MILIFISKIGGSRIVKILLKTNEIKTLYQISGEMELGQLVIYMGNKLHSYLISSIKISVLHEDLEHQK